MVAESMKGNELYLQHVFSQSSSNKMYPLRSTFYCCRFSHTCARFPSYHPALPRLLAICFSCKANFACSNSFIAIKPGSHHPFS
jgi:hypothetical protein